ncbi:MAG: hypothetical protein JXK07_07360 [Spirochaetes bacterium]|nr:hypothetical protein [Spirochaetota bacterium]MBN2769671.1 hypothetical protein [Spirochaetota bacterium]
MKYLYKALRSKNNGPVNQSAEGINEHMSAIRCDVKKSNQLDHLFQFNTGKDSSISPFYLARLAYPVIIRILINKNLELNLLKLLHTAQSIQIYSSIHDGDIISIDSEISGINSRPEGDLVMISTRFIKEDKTAAVTNSEFITKLEKRRNPKTVYENNSGITNYDQFSINTIKNHTKQYAKLSRDKNPIHTSRLFAALAGLPSPIMHGMHTMGLVSAALIEKYSESGWNGLDYVSVRFSRYVIPGETITINSYCSSRGRIDFAAQNGNGSKILTDGCLQIKEI